MERENERDSRGGNQVLGRGGGVVKMKVNPKTPLVINQRRIVNFYQLGHL